MLISHFLEFPVYVFFLIILFFLSLVLSMDVMDVAGEFQTNVHHTIFKSRVDKSGNLMDKESSSIGDHHEKLPDIPKGNETTTKYCGYKSFI